MKTAWRIAALLFVIWNQQANATPCSQTLMRQRLLTQAIPLTPEGHVKVAFFDADDTLRHSKSGEITANGVDDVQLLPGRVEKMRELQAQGYLLAIVSNQGGIPRHVTVETADAALMYTIALLRAEGVSVHYFDFADRNDHNRKPRVGMAMTLQAVISERFPGQNVRIDWTQSFMVGDAAYKTGEVRPDGTPGTDFTNSDRLFAENLGVPFFEAREFFK